jgi:lipid II:glycine glycyltransferase (peptidoglycan interpeptide bridge formation enzyme)
MSVRFATTKEIASWDSLILQQSDGGNVFSSKTYAEIKKLTQYIPRFLVVNNVPVTVLEKRTAPFGKLWYFPKGPNVTDSKHLFEILEAVKPFAEKQGVFLIKIESELDRSEEPLLQSYGLHKAKAIIPNPSTITLDIHLPAEELLLTLPQKGRHAIRRAERDGVTIQQVETTEENCKKMYELLSETASGQFGIRAYSYYRSFWQQFSAAGQGQLFFAYFEGAIVAGAYAMTYGKKSTYKDGASIRKRTAYGASHLLQWHVIQWAQSQGSLLHDFCGSPPSDQLHNTEHPHHGVGLFKLSLSKHVVDYIGCYDFVIRPLAYKAWNRFGERLYRGIYLRLTKDYYY